MGIDELIEAFKDALELASKGLRQVFCTEEAGKLLGVKGGGDLRSRYHR